MYQNHRKNEKLCIKYDEFCRYIYPNLENWCDCAPGYSGTHCEAATDMCSSNPCVSVTGRDAACVAVAGPSCGGTIPATCTGTQAGDSDGDGSLDCADVASFDGSEASCPVADDCVWQVRNATIDWLEMPLLTDSNAPQDGAACTYVEHNTTCAGLGVPPDEATCTL